MSGLNNPQPVPMPVEPNAPAVTPEQQNAAWAAEMATFTNGDTPAQNHDPDYQPPEGEEAPKPKTLPDKALIVEEENAETTRALVEDDAPRPGEEPAEPRKKASERIAELTRARGEEARRAEAAESRTRELEARLATLESGAKPAAPAKGAEAPDAAAEPKPEDFKYGELDPGYISALADHRVNKVLADRDAKAEEAKARGAQQEQVKALETQRDAMVDRGTEEFGESYFDDVIKTAVEGKYPMTEVMARLTMESDVGHRIAHHLATNPKEAREISDLSPFRQAAAIGRLEAKFSADTAAPGPEARRKNPTPPPPPRHQARGAGGQFKTPASTSNFKDFEEMAMAELRKA